MITKFILLLTYLDNITARGENLQLLVNKAEDLNAAVSEYCIKIPILISET